VLLGSLHYVSLVDGATCLDGHYTGLCSSYRILYLPGGVLRTSKIRSNRSHSTYCAYGRPKHVRIDCIPRSALMDVCNERSEVKGTELPRSCSHLCAFGVFLYKIEQHKK
jgi:hypothetical protein